MCRCVSAVLCVLVVVLAVVSAAPSRLREEDRQACGDRLANIMSLVCSKSGYNDPFSATVTSRTRRVRRGIVEECCRKSCPPSTLRLYCRLDPDSDPETTNSIRKRRDNTSLEQGERLIIEETQDKRPNENQSEEPTEKSVPSDLQMDQSAKGKEPHHQSTTAKGLLTKLKVPI